MIKKSRNLTIFMMIAVVVIYSTIVYKSIANKKIVAELNEFQNLDYNYNVVNYKKDDFNISNSINDPFSSFPAQSNFTTQSISAPNKYHHAKKRLQEVQQASPIKWPQIKYFGFIKNTSSNKKELCLLSFNNTLIKKAEGEQFNGVRLVAVYRDSIVLKYNNEIKVYQKK